MSLTYNNNDANIPIAFDKEIGKVIYYEKAPKNVNKEINIAYGKFNIVPNWVQGFENIQIVGKSGVGKSTVSSQYAFIYRTIYPDNDIYILSQKENDPAYEKDLKGNELTDILKIKRIKVDEEFINSEIDITKQYKNCLLIFDDFLYYPKIQYIKKICNMIIQILNLGRVNHIFCLLTSHLFYHQGAGMREMIQNIHNELHKLVFFNAGLNQKQINYVLSEYWGFNKKRINKILTIDKGSRWICLFKEPSLLLTNNYIELLE